MEESQTEVLAHHLIDVIGPRLAGSPNLEAAQSWIMGKYGEWGVTVEKEQYGTWRFERLEGQGFQASSVFIPKWLGALPTDITSHIVAEVPGAQNNSGSDHTAFLCAGAPSFRLQSL